jgi:hypothetical protein
MCASLLDDAEHIETAKLLLWLAERYLERRDVARAAVLLWRVERIVEQVEWKSEPALNGRGIHPAKASSLTFTLSGLEIQCP